MNYFDNYSSDLIFLSEEDISFLHGLSNFEVYDMFNLDLIKLVKPLSVLSLIITKKADFFFRRIIWPSFFILRNGLKNLKKNYNFYLYRSKIQSNFFLNFYKSFDTTTISSDLGNLSVRSFLSDNNLNFNIYNNCILSSFFKKKYFFKIQPICFSTNNIILVNSYENFLPKEGDFNLVFDSDLIGFINYKNNFNFLFYFIIFNKCLFEIYKINTLLYFYKVVN